MRTNLNIDDAKLTEFMERSGVKTKREAVDLALNEALRLRRQADIRKFQGKLHWEGDLDALRTDR